MKFKKIKEETREYIDPKQMIALEEELQALKRENGQTEQTSTRWWMQVGDWLVGHFETQSAVRKKTYLKLALCCGWFCGAHRFYAGHRVCGALYLLFCWTGIPFAMTLIDLMIVLPMKQDENGLVIL